MRGLAHRFLRGEAGGPLAALLRLPLIPPGLALGELAALRGRFYEWGWLRSEALPLPVVSVGNLVCGGVGKTPFVRYLALLLEEMGQRPLILGRGFGHHPGGGELDEEGLSLARDLPGSLVVQGRDRARSARPHLQDSPRPSVIILDDGAQHLRLRRDLEILLVDASCPFGAGWPLPAGSLREFPRGLARAQLLVVTRTDEVSPAQLEGLRQRLARLSGGRPQILSCHRPHALLPEGRLEDLAGRRVWLVSGIGHPASFRRLIAGAGARIVGEKAFPDHHACSKSLVSAQAARAAQAGAELIVSTGKDEPKLTPLLDPHQLPWRFLEVRVQPDPEGAELLQRRLSSLWVTAPQAAAGQPRRSANS